LRSRFFTKSTVVGLILVLIAIKLPIGNLVPKDFNKPSKIIKKLKKPVVKYFKKKPKVRRGGPDSINVTLTAKDIKNVYEKLKGGKIKDLYKDAVNGKIEEILIDKVLKNNT
jgi:hypothetical protein